MLIDNACWSIVSWFYPQFYYSDYLTKAGFINQRGGHLAFFTVYKWAYVKYFLHQKINIKQVKNLLPFSDN